MGAVRDLYEEAIARYNAGDVEGFVDAHAEDAVLVTPAGTARSRAAIQEHWSREKAAYPDRTLRVNALVEQDDTVATEWTWAGTNTGPLVLRDGTRRPPTGRPVELRGMELARLREGKIVEYHIYWDGMAIARQLGALSEPTTSPTRSDIT